MRALFILVLPLLVQALAYVGVFIAARGGGSFMGLLAMPVAAAAVLGLLVHGIAAVRHDGGMLRPTMIGLAIAVVPPLALLVVRALES